MLEDPDFAPMRDCYSVDENAKVSAALHAEKTFDKIEKLLAAIDDDVCAHDTVTSLQLDQMLEINDDLRRAVIKIQQSVADRTFLDEDAHSWHDAYAS